MAQRRSENLVPAISNRQAAILGATVLVAFSALAALLVLLKSNYEVVEKGHLLPYTFGTIYKVRFFDLVDVYLEPERRRLSSDLITGGALIYISALSLVFLIIIARAGNARHRKAFWMFLLMAVGAGYLAADETLGIHESIGHNLQFLRNLPLIDRPDDAIIMSYAVPTLLYLYVFRREIFVSRAAIMAMLMVVIFGALAAVADLTGWALEELLEVASIFSLVAAMLLLGMHHIADLLISRDQARCTGGAQPDGMI